MLPPNNSWTWTSNTSSYSPWMVPTSTNTHNKPFNTVWPTPNGVSASKHTKSLVSHNRLTVGQAATALTAALRLPLLPRFACPCDCRASLALATAALRLPLAIGDRRRSPSAAYQPCFPLPLTPSAWLPRFACRAAMRQLSLARVLRVLCLTVARRRSRGAPRDVHHEGGVRGK